MTFAEKLKQTYEQASKEVDKKLKAFMARHKAKAEQMRKDVQSGKITEEDYQDWLRGQVFQGERWREKLNDITKTYVDADKTARELVGDRSKNIFATFANSTARDIRSKIGGGVSFDMYDRHTVERLLRENPQMLPEWKINEKKDYRWNAQRVQNAITQGIVQGESIPQLAKRLTSELSASNARHMTLFARTAMTGAQNAGRVERLHEAQGMGIVVKKKWLAAHDNRVRDAHAELDGQTVDVDEPFHSSLGDIKYPGDPTADPANVYNCRCTLTYVYDVQASRENLREREKATSQVTDGATNDTTGNQVGAAYEPRSGRAVVDGRDITATWTRRSDEFEFEIRDVINAQGFDGKPRVVDAEEFDKLVKQANGGEGFIAQRTYSAPDQRTLDDYREALYHGEWYVECTTGGAQFGQGMYCAADYEGKLTPGIAEEMKHYQLIGADRLGALEQKDIQRVAQAQKEKADEILARFKSGAISKEAGMAEYRAVKTMTPLEFLATYMKDSDIQCARAYTETFTLDSSAKIITHEELGRLRSYSGFEERLIRGWGLSDSDTHTLLKALVEDEAGYESLPMSLRGVGKEIEDRAEMLMKMDEGSLAASLGYDAIRARGGDAGSSYTVILNRTKVIFRGGK